MKAPVQPLGGAGHVCEAVTVYPRPCGGTDFDSYAYPYQSGLSPPMRGNRTLRILDQDITRSIPAHAGEPASVRCISGSGEVYPRPCGGTHGA